MNFPGPSCLKSVLILPKIIWGRFIICRAPHPIGEVNTRLRLSLSTVMRWIVSTEAF